ncbi:DUF445 domain-containing protein [Paenibacillus shunpengii]|uniref:DUF445 domain-containing protein n=1 Tax=Paenibacillus shunpengii TaxID=2054424 RepID=A0ABW5SPU2_9BACL|nr:DUF445 domain-containing protein [Paenibacillus sp. FSL H7-0326]OMC65576.1 hypothetical protein BK126_23085 [Paenibacillus sp. FSL H7-0326]SDX22947.1 Uncharacterized membrane-anchored protein YjiN, DUF445 family [Paenibacillus sp. PDC88]
MVKQTKKAAAWSLVIMGAGFAASLPFQDSTVGKMLVGSFEAGLVGGLADWFAVTALFRHPLGLKIPHTALLPKNRKKITEALVSAVENNLLNKDSIAAKIAEMPVSQMILEMAEKELHTTTTHEAIDKLAKRVISSLPLEKIAPLVAEEIKRQVGRVEIEPLLSKAEQYITSKGYDRMALDYGLDQAEEWLVKPDTQYTLGEIGMRAMNSLQVNGLMQFALNAVMGYLNEERLGGILQRFLYDQVQDLKYEGHPRRQSVLNAIRGQVQRLAHSKKVTNGLEEWRDSMLQNWDAESAVLKKLVEFREQMLGYMEDGSYVEKQLIPVISSLVAEVKEDAELLERINQKIVVSVTTLLERNHSKIGQLVRENIDKMDNKTLIAMMEDKLGEDLQWIRINGAVTGFMIGIVLTALQLALA